jgi:hypothetical protein
MSAETKMYGGLTEQDIRKRYMESLTARLSGQEMVIAGLLSDCQELLAMKNPSIPSPFTDELICANLNIAKFILFEMLDKNNT